MSIRFPLDLGHRAENNFPYMSFDIVKFRDRNFIEDSAPSSSGQITKQYNAGVNDTEKPKVLETIYLPLPDNVQNSYSPSWEMTDLRMVEGIRDAIQANGIGDASKILGGTMAGLVAGDFMKKIFSQTPNPKKQAIFNGIEPRSFSWQWTFLPYSKKESETIEKIIKSFTEHSLPNLEKVTDSFFDFPAEFGINFKNVKGFPLLNYCVCSDINVSYSQSNTQIMEDGHASQITLSMSFLETDLRTKTRPGV